MRSREAGVIGLFVLSSMLGGCGGGGGGSGGSPSVTPATTFLPPGTNESLRSPTREERFSAFSFSASDDETVPTTSISVAEVEEGTTTYITLRPSESNPAQRYDLRVESRNPAEGVSTNYNYSVGVNVTGSTVTELVATPHDNIRVTAARQGDLIKTLITNDLSSSRTNLSHQVFGIWANETTTTYAEGGLFSVGVVTGATAVPPSGQATYTGVFIGMGGTLPDTTSNTYFVSARFSANVDFAARTVVVNTADTQRSQALNSPSSWSAFPEWNISGTLNIDAGRGTFRGTVETTGSTLRGVSVGRFYGPNANELGGLLDLASSNGQTGLTGAYGGVRGPITTP